MLLEDSPLLLQMNVAGTFDKVGEVSFGPDVQSNAKILRPLLKYDLVPSWPPAFSYQQVLVPPPFP